MPNVEMTVKELLEKTQNKIHRKSVEGLAMHAKVVVDSSQLSETGDDELNRKVEFVPSKSGEVENGEE